MNHSYKAPPTHAVLSLQGILFSVDLHKAAGKITLPSTVKVVDHDTALSTEPDRPVEFGRPGKHGARTGIRISLDRADAADLRVAQSFLGECLALIETEHQPTSPGL